MRIALYAFLAFTVTAVGIVCAQSTPEKHIAKQQTSADSEKPNAPNTEQASPNVTVIVKQESSSSDKTADHASQEDIDIQRQLARFTGWLVFVGIVQAAILGFTVWAISRQTSVARNSERAWMVAKVEGEVIPQSEGVRLVRFSVRCANNGKTPAFLSEMGNHGIVQTREKDLPEPQLPYDKQNVDSWKGRGITLQPQGYLLRHNYTTIAPELERLIQGDDWLWVYGYIKYRDVFGKSHETKYCFLWDCVHDVPGVGKDTHFLIMGPPSYNQAN